MQIPVVSTRLGAVGLDLEDGIHLRLADDAATMAHAITELCALSDRAQEMARRGRQKVLESYDWAAVTLRLCQYYDKALSEN
jgi:polysaccharide biosynthesis protein PslH